MFPRVMAFLADKAASGLLQFRVGTSFENVKPGRRTCGIMPGGVAAVYGCPDFLRSPLGVLPNHGKVSGWEIHCSPHQALL